MSEKTPIPDTDIFSQAAQERKNAKLLATLAEEATLNNQPQYPFDQKNDRQKANLEAVQAAMNVTADHLRTKSGSPTHENKPK
jgi:hypothetical protein